MSGLRLSIAASLLLFTAGTHGQEFPKLPANIRGPWHTRQVEFGRHTATMMLPETWTLHDSGITVSDDERAHCRIHVAIAPGTYKEALANALAEDRVASRETLHSELCGNSDSSIVSVRYASETGELLEKRYFQLPSGDADILLTWTLTASATRQGNECIARFEAVARSFRHTARPKAKGATPPN